jgi:hypothetical protein
LIYWRKVACGALRGHGLRWRPQKAWFLRPVVAEALCADIGFVGGREKRGFCGPPWLRRLRDIGCAAGAG